MFTSKQRSNLRGMAQTIQPITQIGKSGIGENLIRSLSDALEARELIKVSVLNNIDEEALDLAEELAQKLNAEIVEVKGKKIVLYRKSRRQCFNHIEF